MPSNIIVTADPSTISTKNEHVPDMNDPHLLSLDVPMGLWS
jgi:hypothetical protein